MKHHIIKLSLAVLIVVTIVGGFAYWEWRRAEAAPRIAWTPASVSGEVGRGETKSVPVNFTASENASNVSVVVVPALQPIVNVNPSVFPSIQGGQTYTIVVTFSASGATPVGTFDGTIQLRQSSTLARPLPVKLMVTVVPLPPDPGEVGKVTLAGIDSDGDGVRDDVERYVALAYPNSAKTRAALTQLTVAIQTALLETNDPSLSRDHAADISLATECLTFLRPTDAYDVITALSEVVVNTGQRTEAEERSSRSVSGLVLYASSDPKLACAFDPDALGD